MNSRKTEEQPGAAAPEEAAEQGAAAAASAGAEGGAGAPADAGQGGGAEAEALRERYLRLAAEYENYRKRTERERADAHVKAQAQIVGRLLETLDDLERVAHYSRENTSVDTLLEGVQMVERKLLRVLESAGLEVIEASGQPFDPAVHEALMTAPAEHADHDESVGQVFQKGYQFKGNLLRPARVQVRKYEG